MRGRRRGSMAAEATGVRDLSLLLLPLGALLLGACRSAPPPEPGVLLRPTQLGPDVLIRQKIQGVFQGVAQGFEAALQKRGEVLTVIGLTPYGTKAFVLEQEGERLAFTSYLPEGRSLPLQPRYLLQDVHHAFFLGLADAPRADGEHAGEVAGEEVRERWRDGRLVERRFQRADGCPPGEVVVRYEGGWSGRGAPPRRTRLQNGYYGYDLEIETLTYQPLE